MPIYLSLIFRFVSFWRGKKLYISVIWLDREKKERKKETISRFFFHHCWTGSVRNEMFIVDRIHKHKQQHSNGLIDFFAPLWFYLFFCSFLIYRFCLENKFFNAFKSFSFAFVQSLRLIMIDRWWWWCDRVSSLHHHHKISFSNKTR